MHKKNTSKDCDNRDNNNNINNDDDDDDDNKDNENDTRHLVMEYNIILYH